MKLLEETKKEVKGGDLNFRLDKSGLYVPADVPVRKHPIGFTMGEHGFEETT